MLLCYTGMLFSNGFKGKVTLNGKSPASLDLNLCLQEPVTWGTEDLHQGFP